MLVKIKEVRNSRLLQKTCRLVVSVDAEVLTDLIAAIEIVTGI